MECRMKKMALEWCFEETSPSIGGVSWCIYVKMIKLITVKILCFVGLDTCRLFLTYCSCKKNVSVLDYEFSKQQEHFVALNTKVTVSACCPYDCTFNDLHYSFCNYKNMHFVGYLHAVFTKFDSVCIFTDTITHPVNISTWQLNVTKNQFCKP